MKITAKVIYRLRVANFSEKDIQNFIIENVSITCCCGKIHILKKDHILTCTGCMQTIKGGFKNE